MMRFFVLFAVFVQSFLWSDSLKEAYFPWKQQLKERGKIYDCFLFFNEYDMLEIRFNELYDAVDKFVIVEAAEGFRGQSKPYNFESHKQRFEKFLDKVIYIQLDDHIETNDPWDREYWQRNQIMRGLTDCQADDLIFISDVDELIPAAILNDVYVASSFYPLIAFKQKMYFQYLDRMCQGWEWWVGTAALKYDQLINLSPQQVRDHARAEDAFIWDAGWHFTSLGGYQSNVAKYTNYAHGGDGFFAYEEWRNTMRGPGIFFAPIDSSYPQFVQDNVDYLIQIGLIDPSLY